MQIQSGNQTSSSLNMQQGNQHVSMKMNHGGHEVFDVHEVLSGTIDTLNQYMILRQLVKDQELLNILNRQYQFISDEYNMLVQCFSTGQDPSHGTKPYQMNQDNQVIFGMKPTQPKKPAQSTNELSDGCISSQMLSMLKSMAGMKAVAACEVTNPIVRRVLAESVPNCAEMAYELFLYQNKKQFYQVPQLSQQDMQIMLNSFAPTHNQPPMSQPNNMMQ
ncbi:spore coat protein [Hazenella coriacea]|uniref:Spore coat protein CotF n=1 Tax=Hazenella coriacea TaxID=1179467 RepID=A0A4R3L0V0_9BACL|nr:spore coat protein [Hazenella coriacea]TCS93141.1 spore coat protein CotF [Hazenella coriacea]